MNEHLHRALIEVCYGIAEFRQSQTSECAAPSADARALLFIVKTNLDALLSADQADGERPGDGKASREPHSSDTTACFPPGAEPPDIPD